MKKTTVPVLWVILFITTVTADNNSVVSPPASGRRLVINLNSHWLYSPEDLPDGASDTLDETGLTTVCLPHANVIVPHSNIDMQSFQKITWYRRHFSPSQRYRGRRFFLNFQGTSQVTEVFINGKRAGVHRGAYTPFSFDITDHIRFGVDNVIAVRVDSRKHRDIPPEGQEIDYMLFGGIARDVSMTITHPLHIEWIFASRDTKHPNKVHLRTSITNSDTTNESCVIESRIFSHDGTIMATGKKNCSIKPGASQELTYTTGNIKQLREWDIDDPYLYTLRTRIIIDSTVIDTTLMKFGLRSIAFSKTDGKFRLNGRPVWLCGLNRHETYPFIGRAAANRLQAKDADILKYELGCNIVRCSHYPQDPEFLQRCDEIGLLVLEEVPGWSYVGDSSWQQIVLQNLREMVIRDRNHPSVISFGVRINQSHDYNRLYKKTNRLCRELDPTRPTHGVRLKGRFSTENFMEDIWTQNFIIPKGKPDQLPWLITESFGVDCQVKSWENENKQIRIMLRFAEVMDSVAMNPYLAGQLGWCAFDYNSGYHTADHSVCYYGANDMYRTPKHAGMLLKSQADHSGTAPMVYIAHYWQRQLAPNDVWVATNCDKVELFLNNTSLGTRTPDQFPSLPHPLAVWKKVAFSPGRIRAVGYMNDSIVADHTRNTPDRAFELRLTADDTELVEGGDMTRVVVTVVDKYGQIVPGEDAVVALSASGAAEFCGQNLIKLENGVTAFFIKTLPEKTGIVTCTAEGTDLPPARLQLTVSADPQTQLRRQVLGK